jgi:uncharacterized protein YycO
MELWGAFSQRLRVPPGLAMGALWHHCGVLDQERQEVIEPLMFKGVVRTPLHEWIDRYPRVGFRAYEVPNAQVGLTFARAQVGKPYDYRGAFGVPLRANWDNPGAWYCHELLEAALKEAGARRWYCDFCPKTPTESFLVK